METKVMIPSPAVDFNFDSACTSPYMTAPSSPQQRLRNFFIVSAPTSPTRGTALYRELRDGGYSDEDCGSPSAIPFNWEEKPGTPKRNRTNVGGGDDYDLDFAFNFSGQLETASLSADELFDGGKIKPLKPPPRLQFPQGGSKIVVKSLKSPRKTMKEALSTRYRRNEFDPFAAAIEQARNGSTQNPSDDQIGRERKHISLRSRVRHKVSRSLSPFRFSDVLFQQKNNQQNSKNSSSSSSVSSSSVATGFSFSNWHRKWNLLFRNASDGRADSEKSKLTRYSEDVKNSSFRSIDSVGSSTSSSGRRGPPVSAHEKHYRVTRAASEELRKRTFLPYRRGLLGCLGFNSAIIDISRGLNSSSRR